MANNYDGDTYLWKIATGKLKLETKTEHIYHYIFSLDKRTLVTLSAVGKMRQWDLANRKEVGSLI